MENQLSTYIPGSIIGHVQKKLTRDPRFDIPFTQSYQTVVMFADVSGFTAMCEAMSAPGGGGDEKLAEYLNSYFSMLVKIVGSQGGDVFKFAGDALLVLWPEDDEDSLQNRCRRAAQCAQEIKSALRDAKIGSVSGGVTLNVKIGIGVGQVNILHVGGLNGRIECVATGDPLSQAFSSEGQATKSEVVLSPQVWKLVSEFFPAHDLTPKGFAFIKVLDDLSPAERKQYKVQQTNQLSKRNVYKLLDSMLTNSAISAEVAEITQTVLQQYVPKSVLPYLTGHEERWVSELRRITVLFVNLGITEADLTSISSQSDIDRVQKIVRTVQHSIFAYEGSLNKFLLDDKGSTMLTVFGLPPLAHHNDSVRGVFTALSIVHGLKKLGLSPNVGITTGRAFCGVVGSRGRREYSVLGDTVNLAARLMQHAGAFKNEHKADVIVDKATWYATRHQFDWPLIPTDTIHVKGKNDQIQIYTPALKKRLSGRSLAAFESQDTSSPPNSQVSPRPFPFRSSFLLDQTSSPRASNSVLRSEKLKYSPHRSHRSADNDEVDFITNPLNVRLTKTTPPSTDDESSIDDFLRPHKDRLNGCFDLLLKDQRSSVALVEGRMGMGKSKLVYEILRQRNERPKSGEVRLPKKNSRRSPSPRSSSAPVASSPSSSPTPPAPEDSVAEKQFLDVQILCDNIGVDHPLQVWADVVLQLVDSTHSSTSNKRSKRPSSNFAKSRVLTSAAEERNRVLEKEQEQKLQKLVNRQRQTWLKSALENRGLSEHLPLLQPLFPEVALSSNKVARKRQSKGDRQDPDLEKVEEILISLLETLAELKPLVIFLDDVMRMSADAWELLLQAQARVTKGLLLILATRPINHVNSPPEVLHPYSQLLRRQPYMVRISSFPQRLIKKIARAAFSEHGAVESVPGGLLDLIVKKCRGVPLLVKELIYALKQEDMVRVDKGVVHLVQPRDNQFATDQDCLKYIRDHMPVPDTLQDSLGARIDRLSMPEILVLKTAAVVGEVFTFFEVWNAFPIAAYKGRISDILRTVMRKGFIKVENLDKRLPGPVGWETTYEFVHSFMRDTVLSRMLENAQQNFLRSRLVKPEVSDSRPFKLCSEGLDSASLVGPVWVRDKYLDLPQVSQESGADSDDDDYLHTGASDEGKEATWKSAWLALHGNLALLWRDREVAVADPDQQDPFHPPQPMQTFFLTPDSYVGLAGQIEAEDSDSDSDEEEDEEGDLDEVPPPKNLCLTVKTRGWLREGDWHSDTVQLMLVAHSLEQRDQWLRGIGSAIQMAAEDQRTRPVISKTLPQPFQSRDDGNDVLRNRSEFESSVNEARLAPTLLEQQLQMQKQTHAMFARQWKRRWITLTDQALFVRKKHLQPTDPDYLRPQQVAGLAWGQCSCVVLRRDMVSNSAGGTQWSPNQSKSQNLWQLQLRFEYHMKNGAVHHGPKQFILGCVSEADRSQWVSYINNVIKKHKVEKEQRLRSQKLLQQEQEKLRRRSSDGASASKAVPRIILPVVIHDRFTEWPKLRREYATSNQLHASLSQLSIADDEEMRDPQKPLYSPLEVVRAIDDWLQKNHSDVHSQLGSLLHATRNYMVADLSQPPRQTASLIAKALVADQVIPDVLAGFKIRGDIDCWTWNIWDYDDHELSGVCAYLFSRVQYLFDEFSIPSEQLSKFLLLVERHYMDVPYHNFRHALDVVQAVHIILLQCAGSHAHPLAQLRSSLSAMDFLVVLVGALCHDISHPGTDNLYQGKAQTPLYKLYGSMEGGLLENHHSIATFTLLAQNPECNIMQALSPKHQVRFRDGIHQAIMATDMGRHFKLTAQFKDLLDKILASGPKPLPDSAANGRLSSSVSVTNFADAQNNLRSTTRHHSSGDISSTVDRPTMTRETRQFLLDIIIHAADISNPTRPWTACKRWCDQILVESRIQGRLEAERGFELGPSNVPDLDQNQFSIKFIDFIVAPLFKECWRLLSPGNPDPQRVLHFMRALRDNRSRWSNGLSKAILSEAAWEKQSQNFHDLLPPELEEDPPPPPPPPSRPRKKTRDRRDRAASRSRRKKHRRRSAADEAEDSDDVPPPPPPLP